jgi:hypothetical protein
MMKRRRILLAAVVVVVVVSCLAACTHVAPYQRGRLAHPTMTATEEVAPARAHVHAVQEGAVGGGGALAESGCGCN